MVKEPRIKVCGQTDYRIITPQYTTLCPKNFENRVDFHPEKKWPCKNSWHQDLKSTHIRNKRLLDLPFSSPNCCREIYNVMNDRLKLKRVQKYGLTRPVRKVAFDLEMEETVRCRPQEGSAKAGELRQFPECYILSDSESDSEGEEYGSCKSGSESSCSGCSTLGGGRRKKLHKVIKKNWKDLLHRGMDVQICRPVVAEELARFKRLKGLK